MTPDTSGRVRPSRARGITIVETIVLMTVVAAMLGLCVLMLQLLLKLDGASRERLDAASALARLSSRFREDVHAARAAAAIDPPAGPGLRLEMPGGRTVEYQTPGRSAVIRLESEGGKPVRRERYEIPRSGPITSTLDREGGVQFARLSIPRRETRGGEEPPRIFEIVASLGRNGTPPAGGGKP
ncbi:MAG: hypothetical protein U0790_20140 [Isosphaeraceae bacterium]